MRIIGVDFSGAKSDSNTWIAQGVLDERGLTLQSCNPISRARLTETLANLTSLAIVALDFPFSVPLSFAKYWAADSTRMPDLWDAASDIALEKFIEARDAFVAEHGEPKRICDSYYPESFSCLHKTNPNMVPMTFYGMRMLGELWKAGCAVPPLEPSDAQRPVLLEVMPGAALRAFNLPFKGYKGGRNALELRRQILDGLPKCSSVPIVNLDEFREYCFANDDCLDAVVAALAASLWATDPKMFRVPDEAAGDELNVALLEGWLYAPVFAGFL